MNKFILFTGECTKFSPPWQETKIDAQNDHSFSLAFCDLRIKKGLVI